MLKSGERRFARIGRDPEVELASRAETARSEERRLSAEHGELAIHELRTTHTRCRLQEDVARLREHLGTVAKSEAGGAQDQLVKRILEREEQLRGLKAEQRAEETELTRRKDPLAAFWTPSR